MYAKRPNIMPNLQPENTNITKLSKLASFKLAYDVDEDLPNNPNKPVEPNNPDAPIEDLVKNSVKPEEFQEYLSYLMKFWMNSDAQNLDGGLFPTYLSNEGKIIDKEVEWPEEYKLARDDGDNGAGALIDLNQYYVRAHSRQTYAYGMAFHMTGNQKYLELCHKGAMALVNAMDGNYGMFTRLKAHTNEFIGEREDRDSQDVAYGLTGLGMYYFLTRDEGILHKIIQIKDHIFKTYFDQERGIFTWYLANNDVKKQNKEIVAQLDQLYAYMLMITPSLPEPYKSVWKNDMRKIADILIEQFYSQRYEFFWGEETDFKSLTLGRDHTDFGHSVKTFWVIYKIGELLEDMTYINFARPHIDRILKTAYITETGSWARRFDKNGKLDHDKEWWILAELDQACEILALNDPSYLVYLNKTQRYWQDNMVDKEHGEVWHMLDGKTNLPIKKFPKVHMWKTSLHSFEYAVFGYMTSSTFNSKAFKLHFAYQFDAIPDGAFTPYMFRAKAETVHKKGTVLLNNADLNTIYEVTYNYLH